MTHFAVFGPLDSEADAPYCIRGWAPDAERRRLQLVSELYGESLEAVRTRIPDRYERREPTAAERRELPRLIEIWQPETEATDER